MSKEVATRTKAPARSKRTNTKAVSMPVRSHEDVARRAFEIYLSRGAQEGDQLSDWFRAEKELHTN